jgi:two-component system response regulator YesN
MPQLMIVEDEPLIRKGLIKTIQRVAPEWTIAEECGNGLEAIDKIKSIPPDIILSDIKMPGMDGFEMIDRMFSDGFFIPIVFLTGYDEFQLVRQALLHQAFDYLLKPVNEQDIQRVLDRFMKERFVPVGQTIASSVHTRIRKFELDFMHSLETFRHQEVIQVLHEGVKLLSAEIPIHSLLNEVIRIANTFFMKRGIYGLDYLPPIPAGNATVQLTALGNAITVLLQRLEKHDNHPNPDKIIEMAYDYMKRNIGSPISLSAVAGYVHMNPTYFSEYFKVKTAVTFTQYLTRLRMEEAIALLKNPLMKVNEAAVALGYNDARYFSKTFKESFGLTPTEFKLRCY